jgi:hypothetical protein
VNVEEVVAIIHANRMYHALSALIPVSSYGLKVLVAAPASLADLSKMISKSRETLKPRPFERVKRTPASENRFLTKETQTKNIIHESVACGFH